MSRKYQRVVVLSAALFAPTLLLADPSACDALGTTPNLVQNCGFETGDFTGWKLAGNLLSTDVAPDGFGLGVNSGNYFAALGAIGSDNILYQDLTTTVGQIYTFAFYLASDGATPNNFTALWDGNVMFSQTDIGFIQPYVLESFSVTATKTTTRIEFDSQDDPGHLGLDDVEVFIPEPDAPILSSLLTGLSLLGFLRIRKAAR